MRSKKKTTRKAPRPVAAPGTVAAEATPKTRARLLAEQWFEDLLQRGEWVTVRYSADGKVAERITKSLSSPPHG